MTVEEIAHVAGLTEAWVRQKLVEASIAGPGYVWRKAELRAVCQDGELLAEFASLPEPIREAFVMLDQQELPLPPLERIKFY
ncbi:MAG: hypothetical protein AAF618_05005 [Pseudomonadota bacterium]